MTRAIDAVFQFLAVIAGLLLLFITLSIGWSILARVIGVSSPVWTVQFTEYSLLWITFMGAAWLLAKNKHIAIEVLTQRLGRGPNWILSILHSVMGFLLCGSLCYFGAKLTWDHFQRHVIDVQAVDIQKGFVIMVIPFGFALLALQFLRNLMGHLSRKDHAADGAADIDSAEGIE